MNDEVPDEGDFDANRHRGEFDDITPEDFIRGMGNPPGWLPSDEINRMRHEIPIPYVVVVPVRTDDLGRAISPKSFATLRATASRNDS